MGLNSQVTKFLGLVWGESGSLGRNSIKERMPMTSNLVNLIPLVVAVQFRFLGRNELGHACDIFMGF